MSQPYIGEIRAFGFNFAPVNWAFCNGQPMNISDNPTLFNVIGTTYGGNGTTTFNMPNLQGQVPMHWGSLAGFNTIIGQAQGTTQVTLTQAQTPSHTHTITAQYVPSGGTVEQDRRFPNRSVTSPIPIPAAYWANINPIVQLSACGEHALASRRLAAARQHAAVSGGEFLHLPVRDLPVAELRQSGFALTGDRTAAMTVAWRRARLHALAIPAGL